MPVKLKNTFKIDSTREQDTSIIAVTEQACFGEETCKVLDISLSCIVIVTLFPLMTMNVLVSLFKLAPVFEEKIYFNCFNQPTKLKSFRYGLLRDCALIFDVLSGKILICGSSLHDRPNTLGLSWDNTMVLPKPGIFSLITLHQQTGLVNETLNALLKQTLMQNWQVRLGICVRSLICQLLYRVDKRGPDSNGCETTTKQPEFNTLFGLQVSNHTMSDTINWIIGPKCSSKTRVGYFINVNSINQMDTNKNLQHYLSHADRLLPDGSGMRLAAKSKGLCITANLNGTDLINPLCEHCVQQELSIYLLGATAEVIKQAHERLQYHYPGLHVVGSHHGYFEESSEMIKQINQSGADILLVGTGTPLQEAWIHHHKTELQCRTTLAVGGLFDFCSGEITRAPLWMRELGMEWIYRLIKQPLLKGPRYVLGNPWFLFKVFILRRA